MRGGGEKEIFARGRIQKTSLQMLSSSHVAIATTPNEIFFLEESPSLLKQYTIIPQDSLSINGSVEDSVQLY